MGNINQMSCMRLMIILMNMFLITTIILERKVEALARRAALPAIFVFGDSTVDPGNNNFTGTGLRSDFPPYGQNLRGHKPTSRFSDGRLVTDFIARYGGIQELVPAYLDPKLSLDELMTGVSFASAKSGFDPLTPQISVDNFREYKLKLAHKIGKKRTDELISKAVYIVSAGTNDFVVNYVSLPVRRRNFTMSEYQKFVLQYIHQFTKLPFSIQLP